MAMRPTPASASDPYAALGLPSHNATPLQIKVAYRKLALRYHPDRQCRSPTNIATVNEEATSSHGPLSSQPAADANKEATDKFAEISAAYAILSDSAKKKEYDHLHKFGAFDDNNGSNQDGISGQNTSSASATNNYQYTEDYSGGYYKPGYTPTKQSSGMPSYAAAQSFQQQAAAAFQRMQSQDSFFDDLIYSPKSQPQSQKKDGAFFGTTASSSTSDTSDDNPSASSSKHSRTNYTTSQPKKKQPGIGFSFKPLGKHLSVHVPSRNEVINNSLKQHASKHSSGHLFGTRVTYSAQQTSTAASASAEPIGKLERIAQMTPDNACLGSSLRENRKKVVSTTTTRIARGQKRIVKRTAHLHPDGTKEVVIEENGVVRRRYVEKENRDDGDAGSGTDKEDGSEDEASASGTTGGLQKEGGFTLLSFLFKSCVAPCASSAG